MSNQIVDRRQFLIGTLVAGGGLAVGVRLLADDSEASPRGASGTATFNAWARIAADGEVTVVVCQSEMGQGVYTALAMLLAEELDADWSRVRVEAAPADAAYRNTFLIKEAVTGGYRGPEPGLVGSAKEAVLDLLARLAGQQVTGGSTSVRWLHEPLRQAGATMRALLIDAAAARWSVPAGECATEPGRVLHRPSGRALDYGALAEAAAAIKPPAKVELKSPQDFRLIGKSIPRLDTPAKVAGTARFGIDVRRPGQAFAAIAFAPTFGGTLKAFDEAAAKAVRGVIAVLPMEDALLCVADNSWRAMQGAAAANPQWEPGPNARLESAEIEKQLAVALGDDARVAEEYGEPIAELKRQPKHVEAHYAVPYLAHATMEPMNCTAEVSAAGVDVWLPTQAQENARKAAAAAAGVDDERVRIHTTFLGGGFGRRAEFDMVPYAVRAAKAVGRPVQLLYSREQDMRRDYYRPAAASELRAAIAPDGSPTAWTQRIVSPSILSRIVPPIAWTGLDETSVEGGTRLGYEIAHRRVDYVMDKTPVPVGFWRSVGHSQNAFFKECFLDEVAEAGGRDPYGLRRSLLVNRPRHLAVLDRAAEAADWGKPLARRQGRGIALHQSFGSIVACVMQVEVSETGAIRLRRATMAIDCGIVIHPDTVEAQMQGSLVFALTAALYGQITLVNGQVQQGNFDDYALLSLAETPEVAVHVLPSERPPGGVGEPGVPPVAPALVNAIFAATGKRIRSLPLARHDLSA